MVSIVRAFFYGFLIWLITFVVAFALSPLKESWRLLFESIMPVALSLAVAVLALVYFRRIKHGFIREGVLLGWLWLGISIVIDLPLMLSPPMDMTLVEYTAFADPDHHDCDGRRPYSSW
jgi:hypothetical protein